MLALQPFPVMVVAAASETSRTLFFSPTICCTASVTADDEVPMITSTPSTSIHLPPTERPMSGLFCVSAKINSIGLPSRVPPQSSIAILAATTAPGPLVSA